jgi:hypothetical protein
MTNEHMSTPRPPTAVRRKARIRSRKAALGHLKQRMRLAELGVRGYRDLVNPAAQIGLKSWEERRCEREKQRNREAGYRKALPKILAARRRARRAGAHWALTKSDLRMMRLRERLFRSND